MAAANRMKRNPMMSILLAATTVMALLSLVLCWTSISKAQQLRRIQTQIAVANNNRQLINVLAAEAIEYGKKNPAIDPILEWIGAKPGRTNPAAAANLKPAAK
jgi:hypothetical protein